MTKFLVKSVKTGEVSEAWIYDATDGEILANLNGLVNGQGDSFSVEFIHSELFGGMGPVEIIHDDPVLADRVRAILAARPQRPDTRVFGRCGSR